MTVADAMKVSKMAKDNDTAGLLDFMLELVNGETDGLGNEMTLDEFTQLVDAWKESGDTPLGK